LRSKDLEFRTRIRARKDARDEAIKIKKTRRKLKAEAVSRPLTQAELDEAELIAFRSRAAWRADMELPCDSFGEFAAGIYVLELRANKQNAFRSSHWAPHLPGTSGQADNEDGDGTDAGCAAAYGPTRPGAHPLSHDEWAELGFSIEQARLPTIEGTYVRTPHISNEDRQMLARSLAKSPGRKRGRPPIGKRAMTDAERQQRRRRRAELEDMHRALEKVQRRWDEKHRRDRLRIIETPPPLSPSGDEEHGLNINERTQTTPRLDGPQRTER
jgi:hypothetical protein